jgi:hypothetical protein
MPRTKISEFSATAASNTDIDSINLAEGCAPSGINDAIRELMSQLKDFQTGAVGDSFNGPVGSTTAAAGAFTTLTASSTLGVTGVATLGAGAILNTPASVTLTNATGLPLTTGTTGTLATTKGGTGLTSFTSGGVVYASSTSALATGSALTFNGTTFVVNSAAGAGINIASNATSTNYYDANTQIWRDGTFAEGMRLTSTGLGIGTSSPATKLDVNGVGTLRTGFQITNNGTGLSFAASKLMAQMESTTTARMYLCGSDASTGGVLEIYSAKSNGSPILGLVQDGSGNLLVGTTSSFGKLTINSNGAPASSGSMSTGLTVTNGSTGTAINIGTFDAGSYNYIQSAYVNNANTARALAFFLGNTQAMTLDASANLQLGTTTNKTTAFTGNGTGMTIGAALAPTIACWDTSDAGYVASMTQIGADMFLTNTASGIMVFNTNNTERCRIDQSGNFGIGTTSPSSYGKLTVDNTGASTPVIYGRSGDQSGARIAISNTGTSGQTWQIVAGDVGLSNSGLSFYDGTATRMRLDSSGNLLVGTTATYGGPARINVGFDQSTNFGITIRNTSATATGVFVSFENSSGGGNGSISQVNSSAILYNTSSDYRLKNITGSITTSGAYIDSLNPVEGTWKADGSPFVGLIAHELQESSRTQVVTGTKDGAEMQAMDYSNSELIANLIAEIQSLRKRLADAGI